MDLDPLGERGHRDIKDMFKDFQMAKPPNAMIKIGKMIVFLYSVVVLS